MPIREIIYNALILREKYPPLFRYNRVSYNAHNCAPIPAVHRQRMCRRGFLLLLVALMAFSFASCSKYEGDKERDISDHNSASHYNESTWSWDETDPSGLLLDSLWDGDTTINI